MQTSDIDLIVLTYNEEKNIGQCLESVKGLVSNIFVVDSGSTDSTVKIAESFGASVYTNPFVNQAVQYNWAMDNLPLKSEWILWLDADEYLLPELRDEIGAKLPSLQRDICGIMLKRRLIFMGHWIKHGGFYPTTVMRLFRNGCARKENIEMDEHLYLTEGNAIQLEHDFVDHNHKGLADWSMKHVKYSERCARTYMKYEEEGMHGEIKPNLLGTPPERKRWLKSKLYIRCPVLMRSILLFGYRYFFRLGFLDGMAGFIYNYLHSMWYMFLVDCVIIDDKRGK